MLENVACVLAISIRSLVYLQALQNEELIPQICFILSEDKAELYDKFHINIIQKQYSFADLSTTIGDMLNTLHIPFEIMGTRDINSEEVLERMKQIPQEYIIYSGYGGCILKRQLFEIGKRWIHVHAGRLPMYRGSTTAYYSILNEKKISATAIFMNAEIDKGNIIFSDDFDIPDEGVDIDYLYEPYVRSKVLVQALKQYEKNGAFEEYEQEIDKAETYFIIHPVLKHIALMGLGSDSGGEKNG